MRSSLRTERCHNFCTEILISNVLIWRLSPHIFKFLATSSEAGLAFTWSWWLVEFAGFEAVLVVAVLVGILDLQDNENEKVAKRVIQDMAELHHNWDGSQYFEPWHAQIQYYRFKSLSHTIQILVRILTISGNLLNFKWELQECLCSWRGGVNPEHRTQKQHCSSCSIQLNTFSINHFNPWFCNLYGMFLHVCVAFSSR